MKTGWLAIALIAALMGCAGPRDVPLMSKEELRGKLGSPDLVLLDVRSSVDWWMAQDEIVGARRVNPEEVDTWVQQIRKDQEIVLYCG